ncbi:MAG: ligand-binding SRPBCC domain-containing protein [Planctomycetota bacterium]|jgi:ligand-binding SRPBCC domain-containing protein
MARIKLVLDIKAPPEVCFDLSRDLDLHRGSMSHTNEEAVAGRTSGLIELGEEVTWRARHFGMVHLHKARISAFDRPRHFRDEMVEGRFRSFVHDHYFEATATGTRMTDELEFRAPLGPLGALVDALVLKGYLRRLLQTRNEFIRREAQAGSNR